MIASMIGLFLIGGAAKVYIDSKNAFNARSAIASATEKARFAIQDLRRTLVMAGRGIPQMSDDLGAYGSSVADNNERTFPAVGANGIIDADSNGSSAIAIRYATGPAPCAQEGTLDDTNSTVRFFRNDDGHLICEVTSGGTTSSQPTVSDLVIMRALYGINRSTDDITVDRYLTATEVNSSNLWNYVVAIRIGIVTSSGDSNVLPTAYRPATPEELDVLGMEFTAPDTSHFYHSASTTISLRNRNGVIQRQ
jgi:type IV pilus assembly protein PilW